MKKTILILLIAVMLATPCFAQEVEPEGIFSLHGTVWQSLPMGVHILPFPPSLESIDWEFGFYGGKAYNSVRTPGFYIDMLVCSIFYLEDYHVGGGYFPLYFGILQPIGMGMVVQYIGAPIPNNKDLTVGWVIKVSDNWTPPEVE